MFKDFPSLHPLAVHFPIVLILLAAVFQAVVVWKPNWLQIRWAALFLMAGGFLSAWAVSTLFHAMISPDAPKSSLAAFNEHEKYAQYTLWMAGITLLLKGIGDFYKINRRSYDVVVVVAALLAAMLVSVTGHHGAWLTHIEGVGPKGKYLGTEEDEKNMNNMGGMDGKKMDSSMKMNDSMPGMKDMKGMDTSMKMKGMDNMKDMKGMDKMKDMNGTDKMKDMNGMDNMKDTNNMKNMPGMDSMKNMQGMDSMQGMKNMKSMDNRKGMKNMKAMKLIDTTKPYDNNPAWQQAHPPKKHK